MRKRVQIAAERAAPVLAGFALVLLAMSSASAGTIVLPRGSSWRFEDSGLALPSLWTDPLYPEIGWGEGEGPLGYGDAYIVTTTSYGPDPNDKHITTYFRTTFDLQDDPDSVTTLLLRANYDDGIVVHINGQEAVRLSLPAGPIDHDTQASSHEGGSYELWDISAASSLLVATGNVVAVEAHQRDPTSSDLGMDIELETSTAPAVVTRGPYLQVGRPDGMTIRWRTSVATSSRVRWGPDPESLTASADDPTLQLDHEIAIGGLAPGTRYYYSIGTLGAVLAGGDEGHHFRTSPVPGSVEPVRVWVIGDSGQPGAGQDAVRDAYLAAPGAADTDLWLMLGDNAYNTGTEGEYDAAVFGAYPSLLRTVPLWPTRGNHDATRSGTNNDYYDFFTLPPGAEAGGVASGTEAYYSFDHGNVHFVCLDSQGSDRSPTGAMLTWLRLDLAANTRDWTIAYWHHPPYTKGSHDSDNASDSGGRMRDIRQNVLPVADSLGVDLVLCGHSHSYERSFLLAGHHDVSSTLAGSMVLDGGDGSETGDGAYRKDTEGSAPNEGVVYAVAGSSSKTSGGALNHPAMVKSLNSLGSVVLEIQGHRLDGTFLDGTGAMGDSFTILKGPSTAAPTVAVAAGALSVKAGPNPFLAAADIRFTVPAAGEVRVRVVDLRGRIVRTLLEESRGPGEHAIRWNGRDGRGRRVAAGAYVVAVEHGDERRAAKLVKAH